MWGRSYDRRRPQAELASPFASAVEQPSAADRAEQDPDLADGRRQAGVISMPASSAIATPTTNLTVL
jgi:hypothetical protein